MTLQTLADTEHAFNTPRFSVTVGDAEFDDASGRFSQVSVDRTIDGADRFSLDVAASFDHELGEFVDFDWEPFEIGTEVTIQLGYARTFDTSQTLVGEITERSSDFPSSGAPSISISGYGPYHQLTKTVTQEQWEETTDAEIVADVADAYGLECEPDETDIDFDAVENDKESDAAFLEEKIAPRNAGDTGPFEVFVRDGELLFRAPNDEADPALELTYGESLQSFSPEQTDAELPATVEVRNWDAQKREEIVGTAEHEDGSGERVVRRAVDNEDQAARLAEAILHQAIHDRIRGSATTIGLPEIDIGEPIELSRIGRFAGTYYVEAATHTIGSSGYTTDFTVRAATGGVAL